MPKSERPGSPRFIIWGALESGSEEDITIPVYVGFGLWDWTLSQDYRKGFLGKAI